MIVRLRESGMTFAAIGKALHPQVGRNSVRVTYDRAIAAGVDSQKKEA